MGTASSPVTQARFAATFSDVYGGALKSIPWYAVGSYQDWQGNITAERAMTDGPTGRWQFPSLWHTFNVNVGPSYNMLQIVMVDTVTLTGEMLANPVPAPPGATPPAPPGATPPAPPAPPRAAGGSSTERDASTEESAAAVAPSSAPAGRRRRRRHRSAQHRRRLQDFNLRNNPPVSTQQWSWLEHVVNTSTADWLVIVGNDPMYSAGAHGPTWGLVDALMPLLNARGAALYIGGRDPLAQHFAPPAAYPAVDSIVVGNGAAFNATMGAALPSGALCPAGSLQYSYSGGTGFATIQITAAGRQPSTMTVTFYDASGTVLYSFSKLNLRVPPGTRPPPAAKVANGNEWLFGGFGTLFVLGGCYFAYLTYASSQEHTRRVRRIVFAGTGAQAGLLPGGLCGTVRSADEAAPLLPQPRRPAAAAPGAPGAWRAPL